MVYLVTLRSRSENQGKEKPAGDESCSKHKMFSKHQNLAQHVHINCKSSKVKKSTNSIYTCDLCGIIQGGKASLKKYKQLKHSVGKLVGIKKKVAANFRCNFCNRKYYYKQNLQKHLHVVHQMLSAKRNKFKDLTKVPELVDKMESKDLDDYPLLKNMLPQTRQYELVSYEELRNENYLNTENWFEAKFEFTCESVEELKTWKMEYESLSKLLFRVLFAYYDRSSNVLFRAKYQCHHDTQPKKTVKRPSAKHTACSAILDFTLTYHKTTSTQKAHVTIKNTHNHDNIDDDLKFRMPFDNVREKFLKMFDSKLTVSQALARHKFDMQEKFCENFDLIANDRTFMPDPKWAYYLHSTISSKSSSPAVKRSALSELSNVQEEMDTVFFNSAGSSSSKDIPLDQLKNIQVQNRPFDETMEQFENMLNDIKNRCKNAPSYFQSSLESCLASYHSNLQTDSSLNSALHTFIFQPNSALQNSGVQTDLLHSPVQASGVQTDCPMNSALQTSNSTLQSFGVQTDLSYSSLHDLGVQTDCSWNAVLQNQSKESECVESNQNGAHNERTKPASLEQRSEAVTKDIPMDSGSINVFPILSVPDYEHYKDDENFQYYCFL